MILDAKTIDVSQIKSLSNRPNKDKESVAKLEQRRKNSDKVYKLCICLPELNSKEKDWTPSKMGREHLKNSNKRSSERSNQATNSEPNPNLTSGKALGLVFAIKPELACSKFSSFVCEISSFGKLEKRKESLE